MLESGVLSTTEDGGVQLAKVNAQGGYGTWKMPGSIVGKGLGGGHPVAGAPNSFCRT